MALAKHRKIGMVMVKCECNNECVRATLPYVNLPLRL